MIEQHTSSIPQGLDNSMSADNLIVQQYNQRSPHWLDDWMIQ